MIIARTVAKWKFIEFASVPTLYLKLYCTKRPSDAYTTIEMMVVTSQGM